jgi:hypothetical protein
MEINEVEILLKDTKYEEFIGFIYPIKLKGYVYKDLFKIGNDNIGNFVLKLRNSNRSDVIESIKTLKTLSDPENFINKYNDILEKDGFLIMVSNWLNGIQPIDDDNRKILPYFFSKLAQLNKSNIVKGHFTSMYADGNYFDTLRIKINEANEQIRAFELLQVLRKNTYLKFNGKNNDDETKRRIKIVMEKGEFI